MHVEENKQIKSVTMRIFRDLNRIKGKVVNYSILAFIGIFVYRVWNGVIPPGKTASDIMGEIAKITFLQVFGVMLLVLTGSVFISYMRYKREERFDTQKREQIIALMKKVRLDYGSSIQALYNTKCFSWRNRTIQAESHWMVTERQEVFFQSKLKELDVFAALGTNALEKVESQLLDIENTNIPYLKREFYNLLNDLNIDIDVLDVYQGMHKRLPSQLKSIRESYKEKINIIGAGNRGEKRVNDELDQFDGFSRYMSNLRLEVNGQSIETDNVLFSTKGIFLFEVKNFSENGKYGLRITKDGQWQRVESDGSVMPMKSDVTAQHNRHVLLMEKMIREQWRQLYSEEAPFIKLSPLIVIANDRIMVENQTDLAIIRISQIYHHVQKSNEHLSQDTLSKLWNILETNKLPLKEYPVQDYSKDLAEYYKVMCQLEKLCEEMAEALSYILIMAQSNMRITEKAV
ncbi:TPA: nuclease-related domain-containing protein [Bacillus mobilis]